MPKKLDLSNQKFGLLTVIEPAENIGNKTAWKCQCDCGNLIIKTTRYLRKYQDKCSCGCLNNKQLVGQQFGDLTVLRPTTQRKHHSVVWECKCKCGNITYATTEGLRTGDNVSCGCRRKNHHLAIEFREKIIGKKNGKLTVIGVSEKLNNQNLPFLICQCDCGNICEVSYNHFQTNNTLSCGCLLGKSIGEKNIATILEKNKIKFQQEYIFKDLPNRRFDFAIFDNENNIIRLIEFDGEQHYQETSFFTTKLSEQQKRDKEKNIFALSKNIDLIRIPYWERDKITLEIIMGNKYLIKE